MTEPWFAPNGLLNFRSLTWQGRVVRTATYLGMVLFGGFGFFFSEPETTGWWVSAALAFACFLAGHIIVLWKMDWRYDQH